MGMTFPWHKTQAVYQELQVKSYSHDASGISYCSSLGLLDSLYMNFDPRVSPGQQAAGCASHQVTQLDMTREQIRNHFNNFCILTSQTNQLFLNFNKLMRDAFRLY